MGVGLNIEIKAHSQNLDKIESILTNQLLAKFKGEDHQIDTYFNVSSGRLKLREGNIESALIQYHRPDQAGPKQSDYQLYKSMDLKELKPLLTKSLGVQVVVDKLRKIFFVQNAKIHLDKVEDLGTFLEIEIIDQGKENDAAFSNLKDQCDHYLKLFAVEDSDLIHHSYSDMMLERQER